MHLTFWPRATCATSNWRSIMPESKMWAKGLAKRIFMAPHAEAENQKKKNK